MLNGKFHDVSRLSRDVFSALQQYCSLDAVRIGVSPAIGDLTASGIDRDWR